MKIAWVINIVIPEIAEELGIWKTSLGGWLVGQLDELKKTDTEIFVFSVSCDIREILRIKKENINYIIIPPKSEIEMKEIFTELLLEIQPDVVHVWGTETEISAIALETSNINKTVISIQGLVSVCTMHVGEGIPEKYYRSTFVKKMAKRILNGSIVEDDTLRLQKNGEKEIKLIKKAKYVIGRTMWDRACTNQINPYVKYFTCNEILRNTFYDGEWNVNNCERHSIFLSQASSPIKGFHQFLKALPLILERYPDTQVYIAGNPISDFPKRNRLKQYMVEYLCGYQGYIEKLVKEKRVAEHIHFLNYLDEVQMKNRYLKSHAFVIPSSIENSPNSLGEAMILGVPCVAACVGGVQSMFKQEEDGFMYPFDEPYMLAWYVCKIFESDELAEKISKNARNHAMITHNRDKNTKELLNIYRNIMEST